LGIWYFYVEIDLYKRSNTGHLFFQTKDFVVSKNISF